MEPIKFETKNQIKYLLIDLDGTLLGAYDLIAHIRFIRLTLWRMRKFGGFLGALKALNALQKAVLRPFDKHHDYSATDTGEMTNAERAALAVAGVLKLPVEAAEKAVNGVVFSVFPELEPFFFPMPGAVDFLDWAKEKFPMVLATNPAWPQEIIEMRVKWAGIDPKIFRSITHAKKMHTCKPDLAYYVEILKQEGFKPEECLVIGNDMKNDFPAVRVGIPVYIVTKKGEPKVLQTLAGDAQALTGDFKSLKKLLQ